MIEYAEVNRELGTVLRTETMPDPPHDDGGNIVWLPLTREPPPPHDPEAQYLGQTVVIAAGAVRFGWAVKDFPPPPSPEQIQARLSAAVQGRLDAFARERLYDGILSACSYAASTDPAFAAEGARCVELRDATWRAAWTILGEVQIGTRPVPTTEELFAELPALTWG